MKFLRSALCALLLILPALAMGQEIGSYPNATSPLTGTERILADQSSSYPCTGCTVNITPLQIADFTAAEAANYGLVYNNNGSIAGLVPTATGQYCLEWTALNAAPTLVTCTSGSGSVSDGSGTTTANEVAVSTSTAHTIGYATTLPTSAFPAVSGDVTIPAGTTTATVSKVSGSAGTATTFTTYNATSGSITVSPPTGALGTLNLTWPSVSGIIPAITGTVTTGDCAKFASATSITDAGAACGSGGSPAGSTYAVQTNGGSGAFGSVASPTSGPGYYVLRYDPTSTAAVPPTADQEGASTRAISGAATTDTVAYSDLFSVIVHDKAATGAVNETLPTPTTLNNAHFGYTYCDDSAQTDTIKPTTWTISKDNGTAGASISVSSGQCEQIVVDPFNASQWDAFTSAVGGGSSGFTLENGGTSLGTVTTLNCSTGTSCSASGVVGTLTATASGGAQQLGFSTGSVAQATTAYVGAGSSQSTVNYGGPVLTTSGTLKNFYVYTAFSPASGQTFTFTLFAGNSGATAATTVTCQIPSGSNSCSDTTDTASLTAGQMWNVQIVTSGSSGSTGALDFGLELN